MFMGIECREECGVGRFASLFLYTHPHILFFQCIYVYCSTGGADMSLARPGRKQATATEDFGVHMSYL